jgi:hypothetical protein
MSTLSVLALAASASAMPAPLTGDKVKVNFYAEAL